jgi:hypothetical protein
VHLYEEADHGFSCDGENRHYGLLIDFLTRHLI